MCRPLRRSSRASTPSDSASNGQAGISAGSARMTPSAGAFWPANGPTSPSTETSRPSIGQESSESICLPEASPASLSVLRESNSPKPTTDGSGPSLHAPFASFDPDSSSWKTSQGSLGLTEGSETYSGTWPRSGMTRSGTAYALPTLARRTRGSAFSSWPTPESSDSLGGRRSKELGGKRPSGAKRAITLASKVALWPTPTVQDAENNGGPSQQERNSPPLNAMVSARPTPRASDGEHGGRVTPRKSREGGNLIEAVAASLWATPTSHERTHTPRIVDHGEQLANQVAGRLNPVWVEALMGLPPGWVTDGPLPPDPPIPGSRPEPSPDATHSARRNSRRSATASSRSASSPSGAPSSKGGSE
jgi:hypothetical protein